MNAFERSTLRWTKATFFILFVTCLFISLQWHEMHTGSVDTHDLAEAAGKQAESTRELAGHMNEQASQTKIIADQAAIQANAAKVAADAGRSAARTAIDTLHISERAYLVASDAAFDTTTKFIMVRIKNDGRIPSGRVDVVVHKATLDVDPSTGSNVPQQQKADADAYWQRFHFSAITPTTSAVFTVPALKMALDLLNTDRQLIVVAGIISYRDGFLDTSERQLPFCSRSIFQGILNSYKIVPCDASEWLPRLASIDGYPDPKTERHMFEGPPRH